MVIQTCTEYCKPLTVWAVWSRLSISKVLHVTPYLGQEPLERNLVLLWALHAKLREIERSEFTLKDVHFLLLA